jgi:23S rRNA (uracil1939-C5)-methyltransferase
MKKGVEYTGRVVGLTFPNKGKVDCGEEGMAVVKGTVPGQTVKFVVSKKRSGNAIGRLKEVVEKSELEDVSPKCPHFEFCGGCSYQTMSYDNQLKLKKDTVKGILDNAINESYEFQGILQSPLQWEYRNKMEFSFGDEVKDGPLALGMHKRNSFHDIVTVDECQIVDSDYRKILDAVLEFCAGKELPFYKKLRHEGYLRHLLVRRTTVTKQLLVAVVTTSDKEMEEKANWTELVEILKNLDLSAKLCGVIHIINDGLADVVQSDETRILFGDEYIYEELLGLRFKISVFSFFQTNSLGAEVLYSKAREYIGDTKDMTVFDLYSGTGTIAQIIAPVAKKVVGVEIVEEAVEAAKVNAGLNGLDNCEFIAGDVLKVIDEIEDKPDMIILDPPRDGINPKALQKIIDFGVNNLVYISCKPTSLARDLEMLQEHGYRVEKACAVDMFPNTVHVETVALLSKLSDVKDNIEVTVDMDEMDVTSAESKATYEEIKNYVLKIYGLKVSNLYISQIKRKCGIEVGKTYNLPKSEGSRQPQCPIEKEKAIMDALKHFGMI